MGRLYYGFAHAECFNSSANCFSISTESNEEVENILTRASNVQLSRMFVNCGKPHYQKTVSISTYEMWEVRVEM